MSLAVPAGCAATPSGPTAAVSAPAETMVATTSSPATPGAPVSQHPDGAPVTNRASSSRPQGANAAPEAGIFDASPAAASNYRVWLIYEMNSDGDLRRDFEAEAYPAGAFVCAQLALGTSIPSIEGTLAGTKGWSGTGAAAIIKGALNALCPRYNQGYKTYFDRTVDSASVALANALPWNNGVPGVYDTGYFIKEACGYLQKVGTAQGLEAHLHTFRPGGTNQNVPAAGFIQRVPDDQLLRRATHHAVFAGCLGDHLKLNAHWTMA